MQASEGVREELIAHAWREAPNECCGLVAGGVYWPCTNIAGKPAECFAIAPRDYAAVALQHSIEAICHSHYDYVELSSTDRQQLEAWSVPWLLAVLPAEKVLQFDA